MIRRTPLKRGTNPLKRTPLRRVSKKQGAKLRDYSKIRAEFLSENRRCEVCVPEICRHASQDVHHSQGRGPYLCAKETFVAACRPCHDWIHSHPGQAREAGYLK